MRQLSSIIVLSGFLCIAPLMRSCQSLAGSDDLSVTQPADTLYRAAERYRHGEGVAADPSRAFHLMQQAAEQGNTAAQSALGQMYSMGEGCRRDYASAYQWFFIARQRGQWSAFVATDYVAEMMTLETINLARDHALTWLANHPAPDTRVASQTGHSAALQ